MTSIITGDIINSRKIANPQDWLKALKKVLATYGKQPAAWEIYRGDSFQLEVKKPGDALLAAIRIKACIRSFKGLDVRMAIGIGKKTFNAGRVTESNGEAFINSGELFEQLRKNKQTLALKSPWSAIDMELNLMISLASLVMNKWTPSSAEIMQLSLSATPPQQKELQRKLKIAQSSVSERQSRAHYKEIAAVAQFFSDTIKKKTG